MVALLQAMDVFPPAVVDLLGRSWPALLVVGGLTLVLDQVPLTRRWAGLVATILTVALLAGVVVVAYTSRAATERTENVVTVSQPVDADVDVLHVIIEGVNTDVDISPAVEDLSLVGAEFIGSTESDIQSEYTVEEGRASFVLREVQSSTVPMLEEIGRGRMRVELPSGLPVELDFRNANGTVTLNLLGLNVSRLNVNMTVGDLLLSLPDTGLERRGEVLVSRGRVSVFVPDDLGVHLFLSGGRDPEFTEGRYLRLFDNSLQSQDYGDFAEQSEINITASGRITVD